MKPRNFRLFQATHACPSFPVDFTVLRARCFMGGAIRGFRAWTSMISSCCSLTSGEWMDATNVISLSGGWHANNRL